jgi:hypothetical protein
METPFEMFAVFLFVAIGCALYLLFVHDKNNYSDAIAGLFSIAFFIISGLTLFVGIVAQNGTVTYQSTGVGWIFVAIGVIVGLITFVKILDIMTARKHDKKDKVNMGPIRL